jgi:2-oxoglutarate ferredoxin oxidoreductase subunit gamma
MVSVRFVGSGGQGVVLASTILAEAASAEGMHTAQSQSYSAQVRGDITRGDAIMSDKPIVYPVVDVPDIIVAMDESALKRYDDTRATLIYDSSLIKGGRGKGIGATDMAARELPSILYANMILLGFLVRETGIVRKESVESVLSKHPRAQENLKAFHLGRASEK